VLVDFDLASILNFSLDLLIMILIKFRPLFPGILQEKILFSPAYFPKTMSLDDVPVLPGLIPDDRTFDVSIDPNDFLLR